MEPLITPVTLEQGLGWIGCSLTRAVSGPFGVRWAQTPVLVVVDASAKVSVCICFWKSLILLEAHHCDLAFDGGSVDGLNSVIHKEFIVIQKVNVVFRNTHVFKVWKPLGAIPLNYGYPLSSRWELGSHLFAEIIESERMKVGWNLTSLS